jgi:hypothetical protein
MLKYEHKVRYKNSLKYSNQVGAGFSLKSRVSEFINENISVRSAAEFSGYNQQCPSR